MEGQRLEIHVPVGTIVRLLLAALFVWCTLQIWPAIMFVLVSLIFATALHPTVQKLERRGLSRRLAEVLIGGTLVGVLGCFLVFAVPPLVRQIADLASNLPLLHAQAIARLSPQSSASRKIVDLIFKIPSSPEVAACISQPMVWGRATLSGVTSVLLVTVTTLYLLADGRRVFAWFLAYVPRPHRARVGVTVEGMAAIIHAYVRGQLVISALFGTFVCVTLTLLHVPNPLALAILAALCDAIPLAGIFLALVPSALIAFTVSPTTALTVVVSFIVYHWIEAYWIAPRTLGTTLRLPTLAVVLGIVAGYALMGLLGAVLVLPLIAAYPIVEKEWLRDYLAPDVLADHRALAKEDTTGSGRVVEAVLRGERPSSILRPPSS
jgi:predicted PurR-regulated permease PerM